MTWKITGPETVQKDTVTLNDGMNLFISTVKLPSFATDTIPFETMIFIEGSWDEQFVMRYRTQEDAQAGHDIVMAMLATGRAYIENGVLMWDEAAVKKALEA